MEHVLAALKTLALGGTGWLAFHFVGQPFREFLNLRMAAHRRLVLSLQFLPMADRIGVGEQINAAAPTALDEVVEQLRDTAAQLVAFAAGEWPTAAVLRWCGFRLNIAGQQLLEYADSLSNRDGRAMAQQIAEILAALKIKGQIH